MHQRWAARTVYKRVDAGRRSLGTSQLRATPIVFIVSSSYAIMIHESSFTPRRALVCVARATRAPPWKTLAAQFFTYQTRNSVHQHRAISVASMAHPLARGTNHVLTTTAIVTIPTRATPTELVPVTMPKSPVTINRNVRSRSTEIAGHFHRNTHVECSACAS
jgi:hypothetical protein